MSTILKRGGLLSDELLRYRTNSGVVRALDVTKYKKREGRLEEKSTLFTNVFESLRGLVAVIERSGKVIALKEPRAAAFRRRTAIHADIAMGRNYLAL